MIYAVPNEEFLGTEVLYGRDQLHRHVYKVREATKIAKDLAE